jgi:hypothetical protein
MKGVTAGLLIGLIVLGSVVVYQRALVTTPSSTTTVTTTSTETSTITTFRNSTTLINATATTTVLPQCGAFQTLGVVNPSGNASTFATPAFIMNLDSIACVRVTYTLEGNLTADYVPYGSNFSGSLIIGRYVATYYPDGKISGIGPLASHNFLISSIPDSVNISQIPVGSSFSFIYLIRPLSNATGFYDYGIPEACTGFPAYPLAVGYAASQVNASDFFGYVGWSCPYLPWSITSVEFANMEYKVVDLAFQPPNG